MNFTLFRFHGCLLCFLGGWCILFFILFIDKTKRVANLKSPLLFSIYTNRKGNEDFLRCDLLFYGFNKIVIVATLGCFLLILQVKEYKT